MLQIGLASQPSNHRANWCLGSYGFLAGAEPPISDEEKEALRNLIDPIKASPEAAIQALEPQIPRTVVPPLTSFWPTLVTTAQTHTKMAGNEQIAAEVVQVQKRL